MSSIFGIFNRNGEEIDKEIVHTMLDAIAYWVPDERDTWVEGPVAFGHTMLWNTPESKYEHLPLEKDDLVLTMDARIDNREELVNDLELPNLPMNEIGDSEFILAAYQKWGKDCPKYLLGDFVFVIWDKKKQQLFCARDHVGIKPFYYYISDDLFVFTNILSSITTHPAILNKLDDTSLVKFLKPDGFIDNKLTFFQNVKKVTPASVMVITNETIYESEYWSIDDIKPLYYDSYEQYISHFRTLFEKAVGSRLRTSYPVASHLSGGLDSSSVAVMAARKIKEKSFTLHTFNWAQKPDENANLEHPEWSFSDRIAKVEGIEHQRINLLPSDLAKLYKNVNIFNNDMGFFWEEYLVRDIANSHDIRTMLTGWGGDQFISYDGYAYYSGLIWKGHMLSAIMKIYKEHHGKRYRILRTIHVFIRELIYPMLYKYMKGYYKKSSFHFDPYIYCIDRFKIYAKKVPDRHIKFTPGVHAEQKYLLKDGFIQQRIESFSAVGFDKKMEYAYPLLDKRIIEFALAIPEELFSKKNGYSRFFFRKSISHLIQDDIIWTKKSADIQSSQKRLELYDESLEYWLQSYAKEYKNLHSDYIDLQKIISVLENYFSEKQKSRTNLSSIVESIILFNQTMK